MTNYVYAATALTGGANGSLDAIDGTALADGDSAVVLVPGQAVYHYSLDADSAATESSPDVISPDANAGDKRWVLTQVFSSVPRKNFIINGNFDVWQRGTSFSAAGYGADRWFTAVSGSTFDGMQQTFTLGQTDVPNNPRYFSRIIVTSGGLAASFTMQTQRIEFVKTLSGMTATLSFWAKADAVKNMSVEFIQVFGTGGSPSAAVTTIGVTKVALTTSWQKFTVTVALPSISGKTIGTSLNDYLAANFWFDAGSNYDARTDSLGNQSGTFDIAQVQLEQGSVATTFEPRTYGEELALCQRYYWQGEASQRSGYRYVAAAINGCVGAIGSFPVEMRVAPTMAIVTAPKYSSCSNYGLAGTKTGFVHTISTADAAQYQVAGGVYSASAEL